MAEATILLPDCRRQCRDAPGFIRAGVAHTCLGKKTDAGATRQFAAAWPDPLPSIGDADDAVTRAAMRALWQPLWGTADRRRP